MAKQAPKLILSPSRDIPFDRLVLSQANVRRVKCGTSIGDLAEDIARRTLLQSLNVRPLLDGEGQETGMYEVPAGGRRYRALELLVKQKRLAKNAPVPCVVKTRDDGILAEDDSYAENAMREQLHPLDQFRGMQAMVEKGDEVEAIAAHFFTTPAVVRQRLKLASASPALHDVYAEDGMTLDQLMAFTVSDDHERQEQVFEMLKSSFNTSPAFIRQKLTENSVRAVDKRVRFVGVEDYVAAGGSVVRDLFEADQGGWLTDPALLDRLVDAKLETEAARIGEEGWKWIVAATEVPWNENRSMRAIAGPEIPMTAEEEARLAELEAEGEALNETWAEERDVPDEVHARLDAIDVEIGALNDRPQLFEATEIAIAGAFVSIEADGTLRVERGFVRSEDEPDADIPVDGADDGGEAADGASVWPGGGEPSLEGSGAGDRNGDVAVIAEEESGLKPLPDRVVSDITSWRTLALQDAFARDPATAFVAVLHAFALSCFYGYSRESCVQTGINGVAFSNAPAGLRDSGPGRAIADRSEEWRGQMPKSDRDVWDWLQGLDDAERASLFAHCASLGVNAQNEIVPKYDNGRISAHSVARRIAHSHVLARAVGLDLVEAGWRPTAEGYFRSVPKPRILADVTEARGEQFAQMIDHLKKDDMAREAERLLEDCGWLPEPLRTPSLEPLPLPEAANDDEAGDLPPGLADVANEDGNRDDGDRDDGADSDADDGDAIAAE
ncbi:ParB/RepB/Spo0J family partition protein [Sphingopyxis panaciterrae]